MWTAEPGTATSNDSSTPSQTTASTVPELIADDEPEPLAAVAALAKLALSNPEHGLHDLPVCEVAHPGALRAAGRRPCR